MQEEVLKNINALLITNPTNIRYLTGFVGVENRDAYCLQTKDETYLFTYDLYREEAKKVKATFVEISRENPISRELAKLAAKLRIKKLGFEDANLTVAELAKLRKELSGVKLVPTRDRIEAMRMIKRPDEIENIRLAANVTDQCFSYIIKRIRPGVTEGRLAWEIESFLKMKAGDVAFSPVVAFNENSSQPHYHKRGNNPLQKNSLILLDFGARVNGYCADMTRVVFFGTPKPEWIKAYNAVLTANERALELLKGGERNGATLDAAAKEVIAETDLPPYPQSLGHAVGLAIHESPRLTVKKKETLKPNMVVTVEPAVYIEGSYGVRIEDLVLLKENNIDTLSKSPKEIITL
jgi:Xaa-Pro aminopeptidase